tara:strand:+ start:569 stop:706 length:138 start_codon:yes stop_codon:yes gene_type:complete
MDAPKKKSCAAHRAGAVSAEIITVFAMGIFRVSSISFPVPYAVPS